MSGATRDSETEGAASCPHRPPCPGCPRLGAGDPAPDALAAVRDLCARASLGEPEILLGAPFGFRHRARLAVRGRSRTPKVGIFQQGTHRIADIPRCPIHHPAINDAVAQLKRGIRTLGVMPYADRPHLGQLRYVQLVVERQSGRIQMVLVGNHHRPDDLDELAAFLQEELGPSLHSLWWNGQPERSNTILGPSWHPWFGPECVIESIGGASVHFPPGAFGQGNLDLADRVVERVHQAVPDHQRVLELHAGCGAIGLGLLARSDSMTFNEVSTHGLRGLALGLAERPEQERARAVIKDGPASAHRGALKDADVVILDPPRKGLEPEVLDALCRERPSRVVYVSCGWESFQAAATRLMEEGGQKLRELVVADLFPHTEHVETVAVFDRA